jgi:hypothetical protein
LSKIKIISARHLIYRPNGLTTSLGVVSPFVEIEIIGCDEDMTSSNKHTTKTISKIRELMRIMISITVLSLNLFVVTADNGFNPFWDESFQFHVSRPSLAFLRFVVYDSGIFLFTLVNRYI